MPDAKLMRQIKALGDVQAVAVLDAYTNKYLKKKQAETKLNAEMKKALSVYLKKEGAEEGPAQSYTDGEVARHSLLLLASDARRAKPLSVLVVERGKKSKGKDEEVGLESLTLGAMALATACILVLQTHVVFERDKDGKMFLRVEKKPTEGGMITPIIRKILGG